MKRTHLAVLAAALSMSVGAPSFAQEFPTAPPKLKEMEEKGLPRLSAEELRTFFPGVIDSRGTKGRHLITSKPDGTLLRKGFKQGLPDHPGTWRIDDKSNTHCRSMQRGTGMAKKGLEETCFATFRAPDGVHFFDYDVADGFYAHTWRKAPEQ